MNVDGYKSRERPKKRWEECVNYNIVRKEVNIGMISSKEVW